MARAKKKAPLQKVGRKTEYSPKMDDVVYNLMTKGFTMEQLAETLSVRKQTIYNWMERHQSFMDAVNRGRNEADTEIVRSAMLKRAAGMTLKKEKALVVDGEIKIVEVKEEIPPSENAGKFWLTNRKPHDWRERREVKHDGKVSLESLILGDEEDEEDVDAD